MKEEWHKERTELIESPAPKTNDPNNITLWIVLMAAAGLMELLILSRIVSGKRNKI